MDRLINNIARAKFLMRVFSTQSLTKAGILNSSLEKNWPHSDYDAWKFLSDKGKLKWQDEARLWLSNLEKHRPAQYNILVSNWKDIDNDE